MKLIDPIKKYLMDKNYVYEIDTTSNNKYSSISLIIRDIEDDIELLFIKRAKRKGDHFSGHMAFPGGVKEKYDKDLFQTALRETDEEVGINLKKDAEYLGNLEQYKPVNPAANKFLVSPFIFYLKKNNIKLTLNSDEVDDVVWVPFNILISMLDKSPRTSVKYDKPYKDYTFEYKGYKIWGMTGKILYRFLTNIYR